MNEYDGFKHLVETYLHSYCEFDADAIKKIGDCLDNVSEHYSIRKLEEVEEIKCCNADIVKQYLTAKEVEGCAEGTIKNYRYILTLLFNDIVKDVKDVETVDLRHFLQEYKKRRNVSDVTLDKYRESIAWFFQWCHEEGIIPINPMRNLKPIKHENKERKSMTRLELELFRSACHNARERAIVEFLYSTACRVGELCNIKKSDVNFREQSVKIFGKGRKERTSWMNAKCLVALNQYLDTRDDDSEYLFVNINKPHGKCHKESIERLIRKIQGRTNGISFDVTPHIMRHSSATHALQSGMEISEISKFLGHSKLETTMRYAHVSTENVAMSHRKHVV